MRRSRGQVNLEILRLLATENRKATLLAGVTGLNSATAKNMLKALRADGAVRWSGNDWSITPHGREVLADLAKVERML
mgnify:CR=1 FL=1